jgi:hypothetical protein
MKRDTCSPPRLSAWTKWWNSCKKLLYEGQGLHCTLPTDPKLPMHSYDAKIKKDKDRIGLPNGIWGRILQNNIPGTSIRELEPERIFRTAAPRTHREWNHVSTMKILTSYGLESLISGVEARFEDNACTFVRCQTLSFELCGVGWSGGNLIGTHVESKPILTMYWFIYWWHCPSSLM